MARTGSHLPSQARVSQQLPQGRPVEQLGGTTKQGAQPTQQGLQPSDQFTQQNVNRVLKGLKEAQQSEKPFRPGRMLQAGKTAGTPAVMTEELRKEMREASRAAKASDLTDFEKVFLEYFMGKHSIGVLLAAGEKKFREKKLEEWRELFEQLFAYILEKKAAPEEIRELIYRGISNQDPRPNDPKAEQRRPVLIADLYLKRERRDRCEKFIRLELPNDAALNHFQQFKPGQVISVASLLKHFGDTEVPYLALYYRPVREGAMTAQGHPLAQSMARHAGAASQASAAMSSGRMDISSKSANLAQQQMEGQAKQPTKKKPTKDSELYQQKNLLDKLLS